MDDPRTMVWLIDASFGVHSDYVSHTGITMTMEVGALQSLSKKQQFSARSSTEAELMGVDAATTKVLWTVQFWEPQGFKINENVKLQDNKSAILLEKNGRKSAEKRSRALNIRYFYVTNQIDKGIIEVR